MTDTNTRTRTDWTARANAALDALEARTSKVATITQMIRPEEPGYVLRIGDATPWTFASMKQLALRVEAWVEAPV